jgi:hypothetical protein
MIYTVICRATLARSAVERLGARGLYLKADPADPLRHVPRRHHLLIEATTTAGARRVAAEALQAAGVADYDLEVRGAPARAGLAGA